ncbi:AEC family transporter [Ideonella livida]|uniref:AEC family transporter n=1 Tax=Ideonella livida TaxID=2707176 RepID=A0A7C9PIT5_9BURK|nr:AEC family transporter [Ideonella livida]NDY92976.1 AEC family transporter [Ideonella livida]
MQAVLAVTLPFFALVLGGWLAARRQILPEAAVPGLNAFVLFFALPAMLFRFGMNTPVLELLNPVVLGLYLLAAALVVFFTVAMTLSPTVHLKDAAFGALVATFPNTGFMGVPLLVALMGPAAAGPVICIVLADMIVTTSVCVGLAQAHEASGQGPRAAALKAARGALSNPLPWSIAAGGLVGALGLPLPGPLLKIVGMLADAASPVALFTIGAVLWRSGQSDRASGRQAAVSSYLPVALIKLLIHPLVVGAGCLAVRQLGLPLTAFQTTVLVLAAALPSASNVSLLAERYGADNGRVARIILASTALAFVTFTLLAWALGAQPTV